MVMEMSPRTGSIRDGLYAQLTVADGTTEDIHIPVPPDGRYIGVRVYPGVGATATCLDSQSPDADVVAGSGANWLAADAVGLDNTGATTAAVSWAYSCSVSGLRVSAAGGDVVVEVMA